MKELSKKVIPLVFFTFIVILSNLFLYDDGLGSPVDKACPQDITRIELVVQSKTHYILENHNNVSFLRSVENPYSFVCKNLLDNKTCPLPFHYCPVIIKVMKWHLDLPEKHIISVIQKTNRWHQSSDDEASHFIFS